MGQSKENILLILERQASDEHLLYKRRRWYQVFELQIEDPLQASNAQRPQLRQLSQQPAEVVGFALGLCIISHVVA